jgi:hypothetical protein
LKIQLKQKQIHRAITTTIPLPAFEPPRMHTLAECALSADPVQQEHLHRLLNRIAAGWDGKEWILHTRRRRSSVTPRKGKKSKKLTKKTTKQKREQPKHSSEPSKKKSKTKHTEEKGQKGKKKDKTQQAEDGLGAPKNPSLNSLDLHSFIPLSPESLDSSSSLDASDLGSLFSLIDDFIDPSLPQGLDFSGALASASVPPSTTTWLSLSSAAPWVNPSAVAEATTTTSNTCYPPKFFVGDHLITSANLLHASAPSVSDQLHHQHVHSHTHLLPHHKAHTHHIPAAHTPSCGGRRDSYYHGSYGHVYYHSQQEWHHPHQPQQQEQQQHQQQHSLPWYSATTDQLVVGRVVPVVAGGPVAPLFDWDEFGSLPELALGLLVEDA